MTVLAVALVQRLRRRRRERGSAIVEFVFLGVLVTLPVFYLVVALARLQAGAYAVSAASREAGRTFVTAESSGAAPARARAAAAIAFADQGFTGQGQVAIACSAAPCLTRDAQVRTRATAIGRRYMGADRAEEFGARNGVPGELLVRLRPDKVIAVRDLAG